VRAGGAGEVSGPSGGESSLAFGQVPPTMSNGPDDVNAMLPNCPPGTDTEPIRKNRAGGKSLQDRSHQTCA
jgi:hypothetical protein